MFESTCRREEKEKKTYRLKLIRSARAQPPRSLPAACELGAGGVGEAAPGGGGTARRRAPLRYRAPPPGDARGHEREGGREGERGGETLRGSQSCGGPRLPP